MQETFPRNEDTSLPPPPEPRDARPGGGATTSDTDADPEPRWPAVIAVFALIGLNFALPHSLIIGAWWFYPLLVVPLLIGSVISRHCHWHKANYILGHLTAAVVTLFMLASLFLLVRALPSQSPYKETPGALLRSAAALWITNVIVFAQWYWRLDAGGPFHRDRRRGDGYGHTDGAFLFPQMSLTPELREMTGETYWSPNFWDYLFLAFNTSTAFSPTDTAVLSRWAKLLMMIQAFISLAVISLLAARAVNIIS